MEIEQDFIVGADDSLRSSTDSCMHLYGPRNGANVMRFSRGNL